MQRREAQIARFALYIIKSAESTPGLFSSYLLIFFSSVFSEYSLDGLKLHAREKNELLKSITRHLPVDFAFCKYTRMWRYDSSPEYACRISVDILENFLACPVLFRSFSQAHTAGIWDKYN